MSSSSEERAERLYPLFAQSVMQALSQRLPGCRPEGAATLLRPGLGARNVLMRGHCEQGPYLLKLRMHPNASTEAEAYAMSLMPPHMVPQVVATFSTRELVWEAVERRDLKAIQALDLDVGDGLVMTWSDAEVITSPPSREQLAKLAKQLVTLHQTHDPAFEESPLEPLFFPRRPGAMARVILDQAEDLFDRGALDEDGVTLIEEAVEQLDTLLEGFPDEVERPSSFGLCHGDLRWHNMLYDGQHFLFLDFEDAAIGDAATDLAMMAARIPLSWAEEVFLLDAYLSHRRERGWIARYWAIRDFVALLCALGACLDVYDVMAGLRLVTGAPSAWIEERWPAACREWEAAIKRILGPSTMIPTLQKPSSPPPSERGPLFEGVITVDGPSVSYKSPFACQLAMNLGVSYINTGAAYRYATLWAHCHELSPEGEGPTVLIQHLEEMAMFFCEDGAIIVDEYRYAESLLHPSVESQVAAWAALPEIRKALAPHFAKALTKPAVIEGRDAGSVLAPDAPWKLVVEAPLSERVEALAARSGVSLAAAEAMIQERDHEDTTRACAPLTTPEGAHVIQLDPTTLDTCCDEWTMLITGAKER